MRFAESSYLYLFLLVFVCIAVHLVAEWLYRKRITRFGDSALVRLLMPDVSRLKRELKFWILMLALSSVILMLARPQMGMKTESHKRSGIEIMIALDVSNSMEAEDVTPSRLQKCKMLLETLIDKFSEDKVGLIVFAGDAFIQLPLTADYVSAKMFLSDISTGMIAAQGTDISRAIGIASSSFSQQDDIGRAIIVITDGEDHEGGAVEAAKTARKNGQCVFVLGVGSEGGAPIPVDGGYLKDEKGNTVMTKLNAAMCKEVAHAGGGQYIHVDNSSIAQTRLDAALEKLAKNEFETTAFSQYNEQFQAFALIALVLLVIEILIKGRRTTGKGLRSKVESLRTRVNGRKNKLSIVNYQLSIIIFLSFLGTSTVMAQTDRDFVRWGNREYRAKNYDKAEVNYRKALEKNAHNPQAAYNLGNSLLLQGKDSLAVVQYNNALKTETDKLRRSMIYHNIGVVCQASKDFDQAIEAYKASLRLNPSDDETRYNLVLCQKQQKKKNNQNDKKNNKDNKDKNKDNKDKNNKDKNKNDKNNKDKDKNKDQQPPKANNEPEQQKGEMSKETAEQLLNAALQQEKTTKEKMKQTGGSKRKLKKNW